MSEEASVKPPTISIKRIQFSGGQTISIGEKDTVVIVGPNNAGKSQALKEIAQRIEGADASRVITKLEFESLGTPESLLSYLNRHAQKRIDSGKFKYSGLGYSISESQADIFGNTGLKSLFHQIAPFFISSSTTETRLTGSNPAKAIRLYNDPPTHPIHLLLQDDDLETEISNLFKVAFGKDLIPLRAGGSEFPLYVGLSPPIPAGKDRLSSEYVDSLLSNADPLHEQGDGMRSFATVALHNLPATHYSIQLLDEPEAFLHPPQAKLLGRFLAQNRKSSSQIFISTHSSAVLEGLLGADRGNVRIVRLTRQGNKNNAFEIDKEITDNLINDPLARFSRVMEGLFYQNVVITESDADSLFYSSFLDIDPANKKRNLDVLFLHGSGKQRIANMASLLLSVKVGCSAIVDIDILRDKSVFKNLFETFGGKWEDIKSDVEGIHRYVNEKRPPLSVKQLKDFLDKAFDEFTLTEPFDSAHRSKVTTVMKSASSWDFVKGAGRSALMGEAVTQFDRVSEAAKAQGIWIVPVGEVEGFCRSLGNSHGPRFVANVLETKNLTTDVELSEARQFVSDIVAHIPSAKSRDRLGNCMAD